MTQLYYPNPLLSDLVNVDEIKGLMLASNIDIGLMKLIAISSRGSKKDFIDLYCLCKTGIKLKELINLLPYKFPGKSINIYHIIVSLCYFEEAEKEAMPKMYIKVEWDEVKKFFINESKIFKEML
ncbi:nucleotidyl transferase AbiEii/AbiGii toxin family protein [Caldicellulosiruptor acetigenus]|uniref:nucleotidyl transferase AbiEii/AbiGii toxin family protein n=1 Tax=Caldicellulosiruptor acetigenus TaxID=301953 RepID=UPI001E43C6A4|nr:nucleotidyl transferase AbiEii/AbiGii toxin family protein [Caldicellulosiruptor acetigenus]